MDKTAEKFINRVILEAELKSGEKKEIDDKSDLIKNVKLSVDAEKKKLAQAKNETEKAKITKQIDAHRKELAELEDEINKLRDKVHDKRLNIRNLEHTHENIITLSDLELKYFSLIQNECSDFLKFVKKTGDLLYRGNSDYGKVFIGKSHDERKPKDTDARSQKVFDQMLDMLKIPAKRSNSIFVTSNKSHASGFGERLYVIFPKNGFNYTYASGTEDLVPQAADILDRWEMKWQQLDVANSIINLQHRYNNNQFRVIEDAMPHADYSKLREIVKQKYFKDAWVKLSKAIKKYDSDTTKLHNKKEPVTPTVYYALLDAYEIFYKALDEGYNKTADEPVKFLYCIRYNHDEFLSDMKNKKKNIESFGRDITIEDAKAFQKNLKIVSNKALDKAMKDRDEVYISGTYYALSSEQFLKSIKDFFGSSEQLQNKSLEAAKKKIAPKPYKDESW